MKWEMTKRKFATKEEPDTLWQELRIRWRSDTPWFWQKMLNKAIWIGSSAAAVIGMDQLFNLVDYGVPQVIFKVAGYILVISAAIGLSSKITKE